MRIKLISPVLGVALVATGLALMTSSSSQAAPVKLYFHSAAGTYQGDFAADPTGVGSGAPAGSTLSPAAPSKAADATAMAYTALGAPSEPLSPTFTLPFTGDVTTVCLDFWVKSAADPVLGGVETYTATIEGTLDRKSVV